MLLVACATGLVLVLLLRLAGRRLGMQDRMPLGVLLAMAAFGVWLAERIWTYA